MKTWTPAGVRKKGGLWVSKRLRWALSIVAVLNIMQLATELLLLQYAPLNPLLTIKFIPLWIFAIWAFLTSLLLPIWSFLEIVKMNDANRAQERKPILIDAALAFGWSLFFWVTILWKFTHTV